jgi:type IV secretory pathway VirB9-like protein
MRIIFAAASLVALSLLSAAPASAETRPRSVGDDPRIKQYTYAKTTVYRLDLAMKFITVL